MDHTLQTYLNKLSNIQLESIQSEYSAKETEYAQYITALVQSILESRR